MQDQPTVPTPPPVGTRSGAPSLLWKAPSVEELQAKLPQYEVLEILGCGGMGAVYKARQKSLKRLVAIKILPLGMADDEFQFVERFQNEAQTMAQMNHPAIVNVYDFGETADGLLYYVMEFVDGTDVQKMIQASGRLRSEHALSITAHVCDAIAYAHKRGVIHRDIKPANILIDQEGHIKVADFGLAKMHDPAEISGLTKTNMAMGTPDYVAPEVLVTGMVADHRADLYAVGVMLYQMLTGEVPRGMFKLPSQKGIGADPRFDEIICKAMEQDREDRYQSATEVRLALDAILTTPMPKNDGTGVIPVSTVQQSVETQKASGKSKQFVVVAVVAVLAIGGWFASGGMGKPSTSTTNGVGKADTAFLAEVAAATPERQVELVEERIYSLNKVPVKLKPRIEKGKVIELFSGLVDEAPVPDLSPIAALRDLRILNIDTRGASDLAWLRGMNLDTFACEHGAFTDIKPLAELPLKFLILKNGAECDYSVLAGLKLRSFTVVNSPVRDISFLKESPLNTLMLRNTGLTDWSPIRNMPLHEISGDLVPERDADILRSIPTLKIINSEPAAEFFSSLGGTSPPPAAAQGKTVDLLALVDVRRDAVLGDWVRTAEGLSKPAASNPAGNEAPNLQLPYEPPSEFDFEVEFTASGGTGAVGQIIRTQSRSFSWILAGGSPEQPTLGFELFDTKPTSSPTEVSKPMQQPMENGRRHRSRVEVRSGSLRGYLDDQLIIDWSGSFERLGRPLAVGESSHLGIRSARPVVFHKIFVREISGTGKVDAVPASGDSPSTLNSWEDVTATLRDSVKAKPGIVMEGELITWNGDKQNPPHFTVTPEGQNDYAVRLKHVGAGQINVRFNEKGFIYVQSAPSGLRINRWMKGVAAPVSLLVARDIPFSYSKGEPHDLTVTIQGSTIRAWLDGQLMGAVDDTMFAEGTGAVALVSYGKVQKVEIAEVNGSAAKNEWHPIFMKPEDFGGDLRDVEFRDDATFLKSRSHLAPASITAIRSTLRFCASDRTGSLSLRSTEGAAYGEEDFACMAYVSPSGGVVMKVRDRTTGSPELKRHDFPLSPALKLEESFTFELRAAGGKITASINGHEVGSVPDTWKGGARRFSITPSTTEMTEFRNVAVLKSGG